MSATHNKSSATTTASKASAASSSSSSSSSSASNEVKSYATVEAFIEAHRSEIEHLSNGKIRCLSTGTDMPARLEIMQVSVQIKRILNGRHT